MNRTVLIIMAVVSIAALLVPTGAIPFGTDAVNKDLVMSPTEAPNGNYAVLNENGEINLRLDDTNPSISNGGINANAITPLHRVFNITYTGNDTAEVWVADDSNDVHFYYGDNADDSIEGPDNRVILESGKPLSVGLLVDTRGDHDVEEASRFTIHAEEIEANNRADNAVDGDDSDNNDPGEERDGNINNGGGDDTQTEESTPASPSGTGGGPSQPPERDVAGRGQTPDETVGSGGGLPPNTEDRISQANSNNPIELGNIGLGSWLIIVTILGALPSGLAAYRWYT